MTTDEDDLTIIAAYEFWFPLELAGSWYEIYDHLGQMVHAGRIDKPTALQTLFLTTGVLQLEELLPPLKYSARVVGLTGHSTYTAVQRRPGIDDNTQPWE